MSEILFMNGHGIYVWASYAITLVVLLVNVWLAGAAHARNLAAARESEPADTTAARRPKVSRMQ